MRDWGIRPKGKARVDKSRKSRKSVVGEGRRKEGRKGKTKCKEQ
jgi:hypothetical protein